MIMREFDIDTIRAITAFENITKTEIHDCIRSDRIYFLVNPGKTALAIGRAGIAIKTAEKMIGKQIKVFEWAEKPLEFVKNLIPEAQKISINGDCVAITISLKDKGKVIGKGGANIKIIREFLERNSPIKNLRISP